MQPNLVRAVAEQTQPYGPSAPGAAAARSLQVRVCSSQVLCLLFETRASADSCAHALSTRTHAHALRHCRPNPPPQGVPRGRALRGLCVPGHPRQGLC
jgi:hypothetical protein